MILPNQRKIYPRQKTKKNAVMFDKKEVKDGVEKHYEFQINKVLIGKFAIKCK